MKLFADRPRPSNPNDLGAVALMPFVKNTVVNGNCLGKDVRSNREFKFAGMGRPDENVVVLIVPNFDVRWRFTKIARFLHWSPPLCSYTEQLETRRRVRAESNSQFANQGCFLPITGLVA